VPSRLSDRLRLGISPLKSSDKLPSIVRIAGTETLVLLDELLDPDDWGASAGLVLSVVVVVSVVVVSVAVSVVPVVPVVVSVLPVVVVVVVSVVPVVLPAVVSVFPVVVSVVPVAAAVGLAASGVLATIGSPTGLLTIETALVLLLSLVLGVTLADVMTLVGISEKLLRLKSAVSAIPMMRPWAVNVPS
jgi:hypothetical protein